MKWLILSVVMQWCCVTSGYTMDDSAVLDLIKMLSRQDAVHREETIQNIVATGDERLLEVMEAFRSGTLFLWNDQLVICKESRMDSQYNEIGDLLNPLTLESIKDDQGKNLTVFTKDLIEIKASRKERKLVNDAKYLLRLYSSDPKVRYIGFKSMGDRPVNVEIKTVLQNLIIEESDRRVRRVAEESILLIALEESIRSKNRDEHIRIIEKLTEINSLRALTWIKELSDELLGSKEKILPKEAISQIEAYNKAIHHIQKHQTFVDRLQTIFQGLSLSSVLILMALGLAITFGLMGVINMAHGEMLMLGAYSTYETQRIFEYLIHNEMIKKSMADYYYFFALPLAFLVAAAFGALIEYLVVRKLYKRPLESLLATWGIGLILIQLVRLRYGDNIGVNAPSWARGGVEIFQDVVVPNSRCFIILLSMLCVAIIYWIMNKTTIGLCIRATMQNREMANSLGVNTKKVDMLTFAFGCGIAGVAGYAWTLIGGVTPDMGQKNFIVDSFLVVVTGGVGEFFGVIISGLGIGSITKLLEPLQVGNFMVGAIWAKVILLLIVVTFIQFKPAGIFAPKGRHADV